MTELSLPPDVYSPEVLSIVMMELRDHILQATQAATKARVTNATTTAERPHLSAQLRAVLATAGVKEDDLARLQTLSTQLEDLRKQAPVVHLLLTALPNRPQKHQFVQWFREHIHPHLLLTFATRSDIGGGVIVQAGSHVYDFSFREQLIHNKKRIGELFAEKANVR